MSTSPDPGATPQAVPTCTRHPDRETYISCQRCGRPICPECMRPASVGFQCPECVAEGRRSQRPARTAFGGAVRGRGSLVSIALIAVNVAVFLVVTAGGAVGHQLGLQLAMVTGEVPLRGLPLDSGVMHGQVWRLLTAAFLHVQLLHLALNMLAIYFIGFPLERMLGRWRYLTLFLLSCLTASVAVYWLAPPTAVTLGASGGVFGLFGAALVVFRRQGYDVSFLLMLLGINLVYTFVVPSVSWPGHLGGLVGGLAVGLALAHAPRRHRLGVHLVAFGAVALFCVVLTVARTVVLQA